jgi:ATP-dependent Lon protease
MTRIKPELIKNKKRKEEDSDSEPDSDVESEPETSSSEEEVSKGKLKKMQKKKQNKKSNKIKKNKKHDDGSDDGDDDGYDQTEYNKFLEKMFPSKYLKKKISDLENKKASKKVKPSNKTEKQKKKSAKFTIEELDDDDDDDDEYDPDEDEDEEDTDEWEDVEEDSDDESEDDDIEDEDEEDEDEEDDEQQMFSIVLAVNGGDESEEEYNDADDDAECDSEDEKTFMKEKYEKPKANDTETDNTETTNPKAQMRKDKKKSSKKNKHNSSDSNRSSSDGDGETELSNVEQEYLDLVEMRKSLMQQLEKKPNSKILKNAVQACRDDIRKLIKKARTRNAKMYHKLIHSHKKKTNETEYFKKKLSNEEQLRAVKDLKEINKHINIDKPYRLALLDSKMPASYKALAMQKLNVLRTMEPSDGEYYKIKNWVDTFMKIPFGIYNDLSVKLTDGIDVCHDFMINAKDQLDKCVYGLDDAKLQIMQMMGQWISNPGAIGTAIAIKGPMGTGKTTLVKEGISKILGREFAFIALGGAGDSSFLEGHSYTYEGSSWGKIVQIIIESKCMNPVIYFDELDKVSDTPKGEEIIGILTHLTDTTQNSQFHDKYFAELDFDLSKCLFIFSYNDESKVNSILKDRMYRIQTKGYDTNEKVIIARNHLIPSIRKQVNFSEEDIIISDDIIRHIAGNERMTNKESGVRNLKRCIEILFTKLNLFRLVKPEAKMFGKTFDLEIEFPVTITQKHVEVFIKGDPDSLNPSLFGLYI